MTILQAAEIHSLPLFLYKPVFYAQKLRFQSDFVHILRWKNTKNYIYKENCIENTETTASRHSPRPHARCAHWQRYWTGYGRTVPEMRWVAQVFVGASADETPATIHRIK